MAQGSVVAKCKIKIDNKRKFSYDVIWISGRCLLYLDQFPLKFYSKPYNINLSTAPRLNVIYTVYTTAELTKPELNPETPSTQGWGGYTEHSGEHQTGYRLHEQQNGIVGSDHCWSDHDSVRLDGRYTVLREQAQKALFLSNRWLSDKWNVQHLECVGCFVLFRYRLITVRFASPWAASLKSEN